MKTPGTPHFLDVHGTTLHWVERGHGRPIVLLHGLADSHRTWERLAAAFPESRYRLLLVDLAGHGLSSRPQTGCSLDWHASMVGDWLDAIGVDTFDVVGHSFGGGVAQMLLLRQGARIQRLGLVAPGGLGREVAWGVRFLTLPGAATVAQPFLGLGTLLSWRLSLPGVRSKAEAEEIAWLNARPGTARTLAMSARDIANLKGQTRHFLDRAADLTCLPPVGLFWGDRDPIIPASHGANAVRVMKHARLTVFRGCGHFPHLEAPRPFQASLTAFLDDPTLRPTRVAIPRALPPRTTWWKRFAQALGRIARCAMPRHNAA